MNSGSKINPDSEF